MSTKTKSEQEMLNMNTNIFYEAYDTYLDLKKEGFLITLSDAIMLRLIAAIEDRGADISSGVNDLWYVV